ncbi:MAG: lipopolysaccharide heptosyltransferase II [Candidatus Omnitrophica bacterium]|nr:lipopolysaccharide heptosyltransferase II [Candidatus Omnitrophota bacterium]
MHVLQLLPGLEVGGVERGVVDLAGGLIRRGHQVTVVSAGGGLVEPLRGLGAEHVELPVGRKSPNSVRACALVLAQLIGERGIEVVHARSRAPAWAGYFAARHCAVPFVTTCHGFYTPHPASWVMAWGRTVIVPSHALGRYIVDRFGVDVARLCVIPRGVDLEQFRFRGLTDPPSRQWRIGLVGRLTAIKGHDTAIRALGLLRRQGAAVQLCVIGNAPVEQSPLGRRLAQLAGELGVEQAIDWGGVRPDIPACLASLDAVVVPSRYPESFGRSALEAQAIGVPVVASRIGGLAEIIEHEQTGLLVPVEDPAALAAAVSRLMHDEPLRRRLIEQARMRVESCFGLERMVDETAAVYRDCVTNPRVVVWKLSALGDVILASPSLRSIRRRFPTSTISLVTRRAFAQALARCPYVDHVVLADGGPRGWGRRLSVLRRLKRTGFDLSIDLQNSRQTHLWSWLIGARVRVGYDRRWGALLNRPVTLPAEPMSPVAHQQALLKAAGVDPDGEAIELWPSGEDERRADALLREARLTQRRPLVGVHPGGSPKWKTKRWPIARWAALCDRLSEQGAQVIVTGAPAERALGEQLLTLVHSRPALAIGRTSLMELACLIKRCDAFVCNDSAPLHLAAAVGTPVVALFGPTDPARHAPSHPSVRTIHKRVFCSPCYSSWCRTVTHACMQQISVEEVLRIAQELLTPPKQPTAVHESFDHTPRK